MRGMRGQQKVAHTALENANDLEHEIWVARKMWAHEPTALKHERLTIAAAEGGTWKDPRTEIRKKGRK